MPGFDLIAIGRAGLDLYAEQVGSSFERIETFAAYVGGTPANIAVGIRRLGLQSALSTAVSDDPVGDFILRFLNDEGVDTGFISRKPGTKSGMTLLGIMPPGRFPRVHFRENGADLRQTIADVVDLPMATTRAVLVVGTSLCTSPGREATLFVAEQARREGATVVLDLDYRPDLWPDPLSYAVSVRGLVRLCDTAIGTEEEIMAATAPLEGGAAIGKEGTGATTDSRSEATMDSGTGTLMNSNAGAEMDDGSSVAMNAEGRLTTVLQEGMASAVRSLIELGPEMVVEKRGTRGSRIHRRGESVIDVPGFQMEVQNTLGAGDAFASGFLCGMLRDWDPVRAARFGNACGAIVVGRHACSASCPTFDEAMSFIDVRGGF